MSAGSISELLSELGSTSTPADIAPLLDHPESEQAHVLMALRKRNLASSAIEAVARHPRWRGRHVIRAAIVNHRLTPRTLALRLIPHLFWRELLKTTANFRLPMPVRIAAERRLRERLPELEDGEKISLARSAPIGVFSDLILERNHRIIQALLTNPRLRELDVLALAKDADAPAHVLRVVATSERWIHRPPITLAVVTNPHTPVHESLSLIRRLPRRKLHELVEADLLPPIARIGAEKILANESETPSR